VCVCVCVCMSEYGSQEYVPKHAARYSQTTLDHEITKDFVVSFKN